MPAAVLSLEVVEAESGLPISGASARVRDLPRPGSSSTTEWRAEGLGGRIAVSLDLRPFAAAGEAVHLEVEVEAPGRRSRSRRITMGEAEHLDLGRFALERSHRIAGEAFDLAGRPLRKIRLIVATDSALRRYAAQEIVQPRLIVGAESIESQTDAEGGFVCDVGWSRVSIYAEPVAGIWLRLAEAVDVASPAALSLRLQLTMDVRQFTIAGVVSGPGAPGDEVEIECRAREESGAVDRRRSVYSAANADRSFAVAPSPGARYDVRAVCRSASLRSRWIENVPLGTTSLELPLEPVRTLKVQIVDPLGRGRDANIFILPAANFASPGRPPLRPRLESVLSGPRSTVFSLLEPEVEFGLRASAGDSRVGWAGPWRVGECPDHVNVELSDDATRIEGIVECHGRPVAGAVVSLFPRSVKPFVRSGCPDTAARLHSSTTTDGRGAFTLFPPINMPLIIVARDPQAGIGDADLDALHIDEVARVEVRVRGEFGILRGSVDQGSGCRGRMVVAKNGRGIACSTWAGADGRWSFNLPAGSWHVAETWDAPVTEAGFGEDDSSESAVPRSVAVVVAAGRAVEIGCLPRLQ